MNPYVSNARVRVDLENEDHRAEISYLPGARAAAPLLDLDVVAAKIRELLANTRRRHEPQRLLPLPDLIAAALPVPPGDDHPGTHPRSLRNDLSASRIPADRATTAAIPAGRGQVSG